MLKMDEINKIRKLYNDKEKSKNELSANNNNLVTFSQKSCAVFSMVIIWSLLMSTLSGSGGTKVYG